MKKNRRRKVELVEHGGPDSFEVLVVDDDVDPPQRALAGHLHHQVLDEGSPGQWVWEPLSDETAAWRVFQTLDEAKRFLWVD